MSKYIIQISFLVFLLSYIVFAQFDYDLFETIFRSLIVSIIFAASILLILIVYKNSKLPEENLMTEEKKDMSQIPEVDLKKNLSYNLHQDDASKEKN